MKTTTEWNTYLSAAETLDDLLLRLHAWEQWVAEHPGDASYIEPDLTNLPTFGGAHPTDTEEVWSWDADRAIITSGGPFKIVDRDEYKI